MFSDSHSESLRQGDILEKVWFTPAIIYKIKDEQFLVPQTTLRRAYLVIISQCCELQWYVNDQGIPQPRRPFILVAPLSFNMPFTSDSNEYSMLIENGLNKPENDPIQFFYFKENSKIGSQSVVDFSMMMPFRNALIRDLGLKKLLELDIKHRHLFRTRLHEYFSRIPSEDWEEVKSLFPDNFA